MSGKDVEYVELELLEETAIATAFEPNGADKIIALITEKVSGVVFDMSNAKSRKECVTLARKVASSKTKLDDYGKSLTEDYRAKTAAINGERKKITTALDALRDKVREPVTAWEDAEDKRVERHKESIDEIRQAASKTYPTSVECEIALEKIKSIEVGNNFEEFEGDAFSAKNESIQILTEKLEAKKKHEAEQAELEKLRKEKIENERIAREERIAQEAREKATREAQEQERKRNEERERLAREEAAKAERDAQRRIREAEEKAEREIRETKQREQERIEQERKEAEAKAAREADISNRERVLRGIENFFQLYGVEADDAKAMAQAIVRGEVDNLKIIF